MDTVAAPTAYSKTKSHPIIQAINSPIVAKEAAIFDNVIGYDAIIYVFAPEHIRLERLQKRDAFRPIEVTKEIIKQQQSDAEFRKIATHVLVNDNKSLLIPPILKLWESLKVD